MNGERGARWWLALVGLPIGFVSALCGIGGGLMAGSLLHFGFGFDLRRATGTALLAVLATTGAATAVELTRGASPLELTLFLVVASGAWVGARIGFALSERIAERPLRVVFAVVLAVAALRLFTSGDAGPPSTGPADRSALELGVAALVGVGGGFVAPLLGVGGGLMMVPGLFLLVPGTSFDAARATSLAAGVVGASRSLFLKANAGRVSRPHGLLLGTGTLLGSAIGVAALSRLDFLVQAGRIGLAVILLVVSLKFVLAARQA